MRKLMYLKKESAYTFAPAIVELIDTDNIGLGKVRVLFTEEDLNNKDYIYNDTWDVYLNEIRKPTLKELLQIPLKSYKHYFKRKVK